ncbi:MAG: helix-turn-helix transcriptional regulator [Clostridiaceae bacterium]|jgi:transcriptional regulator with XRE-family HTH domain|nr:helix-turn-helix transcriptional regulator [Clostridiaceae bacterium]
MNGIRFFRKKHHMTQNDLAKILGVKQTSVSQWETGRNYPDIKTAKRIAEMYDATLDQILGSEEMSEDDLRLSSEPHRIVLERSEDLSKEDIALLEQKLRLIELMGSLSPHARQRILDRAEIYYEIECVERTNDANASVESVL